MGNDYPLIIKFLKQTLIRVEKLFQISDGFTGAEYIKMYM